MKLRKKLTMTIVTLVVNWLVVYMASKGMDLTEEQQLTLIKWGLAASAFIIGLFNHGQGLADKGKEAGKALLVLLLCSALVMLPMMAWTQPADAEEAPCSTTELEDCKGNYNACMALLDECDGPDCPVCEPCEECRDCGWVSLVKDKTFMTAVIGGVILLMGGIAGIFITPPS